MAKQTSQDALEGRVPLNTFLRESTTSKEHRIPPEFDSLADSNGPLASTFRYATLSNRVSHCDTRHSAQIIGLLVLNDPQ